MCITVPLPGLSSDDQRGKSAERENPPLKGGDVAQRQGGRSKLFDERAFRTKVHTNVNHPIRRLRRHLPYLGKVIHPIRPSGTFPIQGRFFIPFAALADGPFRGRLTFRRPSAARIPSLALSVCFAAHQAPWSGGQRAKRAGGRTIVHVESVLNEKQDFPRGSLL